MSQLLRLHRLAAGLMLAREAHRVYSPPRGLHLLPLLIQVLHDVGLDLVRLLHDLNADTWTCTAWQAGAPTESRSRVPETVCAAQP
jgi:hypothetical protein